LIGNDCINNNVIIVCANKYLTRKKYNSKYILLSSLMLWIWNITIFVYKFTVYDYILKIILKIYRLKENNIKHLFFYIQFISRSCKSGIWHHQTVSWPVFANKSYEIINLNQQ